MLVSSNVQAHVIPGVAKVLEKYTLTYKMDNIISMLNSVTKGQKFSRSGSRFRLKESEVIENNEDLLSEQGTKFPPGTVPVTQVGGQKEKPGEVGLVKLDMPSFNTLSLEPTWVKVDTYYGTRLIGIKVVPFPVKSDTKLINLISHDRHMRMLPAMLTIAGRKVLRTIWATVRRTRLPFTQLTISGDPKSDIILSKTVHKDDVFMVMNLMDIGDEFFERTRNIKWMYKLGWSSFVVSDDVNKRAYFCMKEFNGMCSSVQYNFMYNSISKEHGKVFDDLEDVKKSSSPFFKLSKKATSIIGEEYASQLVNKSITG